MIQCIRIVSVKFVLQTRVYAFNCIMESSSSPRTPGSQALLAMETMSKDLVFKSPKARAPKTIKTKVLDEDTYIEEMGKIIERDFFPDLRKLKAQNDYLDAMEKNDRQKLHELYVKYSSGRPPTERFASPATFETPADLHAGNKEPTDILHRTPNLDLTSVTETSKQNDRLKSLDSYLSNHTSEDNQSFSEIMDEAEKKYRIKYSYLYNEESKSDEAHQNMLALPSIEKQAEITERPFNVDTWNYKNKNYIMYVPDGVELTKEEQIEISKRRKEILYNNTRLTINPFDEQQSKETIHVLAKSQAKVLDGRIGVDGKELTQSETPRVRGFSLVRTPSPCPGVAESPLMTWGQIEGTPFRLDGSDTPLSRSQGPSFKIAEPPKREKLALALAEKAGERHRDRKQKALQAARRQLTTPSPSPSSLQRLASMSPAARRLATTKLGDLGLRASYSPSPFRRQRTPLLATPRSRPTTPKTPRVTVNKNLTDNLLQIKLPTRPKASDFF